MSICQYLNFRKSSGWRRYDEARTKLGDERLNFTPYWLYGLIKVPLTLWYLVFSFGIWGKWIHLEVSFYRSDKIVPRNASFNRQIAISMLAITLRSWIFLWSGDSLSVRFEWLKGSLFGFVDSVPSPGPQCCTVFSIVNTPSTFWILEHQVSPGL